jgi:hypothetical protein
MCSILLEGSVFISQPHTDLLDYIYCFPSPEFTWSQYRNSTWKLIKIISSHILPNSSHYSTLFSGRYRAHRHINDKKIQWKTCRGVNIEIKMLFHLTMQPWLYQMLAAPKWNFSVCTKYRPWIYTSDYCCWQEGCKCKRKDSLFH